MPPDPPGPLPVLATFNLPAQKVTVTWDQPLDVARVVLPGLFTGRRNNVLWEGRVAVVYPNPDQTRFDVLFAAPDVGPDVVDYTPPPFDVFSALAIRAEAFAGFPLT